MEKVVRPIYSPHRGVLRPVARALACGAMTILRRVNKFLEDRTGYAVRRVQVKANTQAGRKTSKRPRQSQQASLGSRRVVGQLPRARIPEGQARARNFFDGYPEFLKTSKTSPHRTRLNLRYEAIFGQNRDLFEGARVLDIASHDGRWSFAALQSGASEVVGIEGRSELVENANETFASYGVEPHRFRFIAGDVYEVLANEKFDVDVVLCLGFLYHTLRYNELLAHIEDCHPKALLIDSRVIVSEDSLVFLRTEPWASERNAVSDAYTRGDAVLTGRPSAKAIETMVSAYGFEVDQYSDWTALLRDNPIDDSVDVYRKGQRVTMRCLARGA